MFAAAAAVLLAATPLVGQGVTIDVTKVQQRYPWNGLVDIDYTITLNQGEEELNSAEYGVRITVVNCEETPAVTNVAHVFRQGTLPVSNGVHRVTWDANAEEKTFTSQNVKVFAEIVRYIEQYMVINVSAGSGSTAVYPVTYLHGVPEGGFTNATYRGDNIVLRLIQPGSFLMGSPTTEPGRTAASEVQHAVAITKPFYIGVFQITQNQYLKVMNANPSEVKGDGGRPVEKAKYNDQIRGTADTATHRYDWPWTNEVASTSFMGKLRAKCKEWNADTQTYDKDIAGLFDLPTEAQWEYACRAGTTTPFNNGVACATVGDLDTQLTLLGRCKSNGGSTSQHAVVGTAGAPNAWGLYDMHGNVYEWCLDWYKADVQNIENPSVDPVGADSGSTRVIRGGSYSVNSQNCRSASRDSAEPSAGASSAYRGFRLAMTLP